MVVKSTDARCSKCNTVYKRGVIDLGLNCLQMWLHCDKCKETHYFSAYANELPIQTIKED